MSNRDLILTAFVLLMVALSQVVLVRHQEQPPKPLPASATAQLP